jgi:hypothetical protein
MKPVSEGGNPRTVLGGQIRQGRLHYALTVISEATAIGDVEQALSTMVLVKGSEGEPTIGEHTRSITPSTVPPGSTRSASPEAATSSPYGPHPEGEDRVRGAVELKRVFGLSETLATTLIGLATTITAKNSILHPRLPRQSPIGPISSTQSRSCGPEILATPI